MMDIPANLGVMVLPGTILLPGSLLPLYIFEPRYREMLSDSLSLHRIFAISHEAGPDSVLGSAGLIRACVTGADGTSHLMLQGVGRIRFVEWLRGRSYPFACVEKLSPPSFDLDSARRLRFEIHELCRDLDHTDDPDLLRPDGPVDDERFSDLAAAHLVADPMFRRRLLEDLNVTSRLATIVDYLRQRRSGG